MTLGATARAARIARFGADLLGAGGRRTFKLTYIVTDECSCRCAICHLWKTPRSGASLDEIEALFGANPDLSWINLSGGEVVEREDFPAIANAAIERTRCAALDFPTAGQHPERVVLGVEAALRAGAPRLFVTVSVDGPPDRHDAIRGTPGAFARARQTLVSLLRLEEPRLTVAVGVTFSSRNAEDPDRTVRELLAALPEIARHDLHYNVAHHAPHYYRNRAQDRPDGEMSSRLREFFATEPSRRGRPRSPLDLIERAYWRLAESYLRTGRSPLPCSALASSVYVDPELTVYPCASWDRPLGNLRDHGFSILRAIAAPEARSARLAAESLRCPNCWTPCEAYPTILSRKIETLAACSRRDEDTIAATPVAATSADSRDRS